MLETQRAVFSFYTVDKRVHPLRAYTCTRQFDTTVKISMDATMEVVIMISVE